METQFTQNPIWIIWNILLALIPVALAQAISRVAGRTQGRITGWKKPAIVALGLFWLAFMPNTCYLLTEWRHFLEMLGYTNLDIQWARNREACLSLMSLTLFYTVYSGIGVLCFALALRPIARLASAHTKHLWLWGIPFFVLMSLGIYLGLIHRFNSWDLLGQFGYIWTDVSELANHPLRSSFIITFGGFLWLLYLAMDIWIDGFINRFARKAPGQTRQGTDQPVSPPSAGQCGT